MDAFQERKWVKTDNKNKDNNQFTIYKKKIMILFNYFKIFLEKLKATNLTNLGILLINLIRVNI